VFADFVEGGFQKIRAVDPRYFDRVLEGKKHTFAGAFFGRKLEQVFALINHFALGHLVTFAPGQNLGESALAAAVRPHDRVNFACVQGEIDPFEDLLAFDSGVEVADFEYGLLHFAGFDLVCQNLLSVVTVRSCACNTLILCL
jgi:hypothetical protein